MTMDDKERKIVRLNVGGVRYDVSRDTIERCEGSMLASLISDNWKEGNSDSNEPIFIDRNGLLFQNFFWTTCEPVRYSCHLR